ncbi:hypothetical protein B9T62_09150 [Paenibacillus donghaensis]|uniref:Uncharacterized protein n=2 Tax=Paenibacillus donghaensis TaxID=414771 RepID=A0A2Z2KBC3_9BACL|nr:hypothetical protein B9T62_09150 [Paenibacillus donghaensis]
MKVSELIEKLQEIPNKDAEVNVHHWLLATKTDKVILSWSKVTGILVPLDGEYNQITIETDKVEEDI